LKNQLQDKVFLSLENSRPEAKQLGGVEGWKVGFPMKWFLGLIRFDVYENSGGHLPKSSIFVWVFHYSNHPF